MKNKNVLKVLGIMLVIVFFMTWIIPGSNIGSSSITLDVIKPVGYANIFNSFQIILTYFFKPAILILFVGMFYEVINKAGAYKSLTDLLVSTFKKKSFIFVIATVVFYGITTGLTGIYLPMLFFIPFSIAVLMGLKYNKLEALLLTVGATSIGLLSQVSSYVINSVVKAETNTFLWIKIVLLVLSLGLIVVYVIKPFGKNKKKKEVVETASESMFVPEVRSSANELKVKGIALAIVMVLTFVVFVLGLTLWKDNTAFSNFYDKIYAVKIGSFYVFKLILGTFEIFGEWTLTSVYATIALGIIVVAISNKLKFSEVIESSIKGAKKVVGIAFIAALINLVVIFTLDSGFLASIVSWIAKGGNIFMVSFASLISTPFMTEQIYAAQYIIPMLNVVGSADLLPVYGLIVQLFYGLALLIAPTSILLIAGLCYLKEDYTSWVKYIWKVLLAIFGLCVVAITIAVLI